MLPELPALFDGHQQVETAVTLASATAETSLGLIFKCRVERRQFELASRMAWVIILDKIMHLIQKGK